MFLSFRIRPFALPRISILNFPPSHFAHLSSSPTSSLAHSLILRLGLSRTFSFPYFLFLYHCTLIHPPFLTFSLSLSLSHLFFFYLSSFKFPSYMSSFTSSLYYSPLFCSTYTKTHPYAPPPPPRTHTQTTPQTHISLLSPFHLPLFPLLLPSPLHLSLVISFNFYVCSSRILSHQYNALRGPPDNDFDFTGSLSRIHFTPGDPAREITYRRARQVSRRRNLIA